VEVVDANAMYHTAAQGGGVRIFADGVRYRVAELTPSLSLAWLKQQIAECAADKQRLTAEMQSWYGADNSSRFPSYRLLEECNTRLSRLDSSYKTLWDQHGNR
jgi:hypothetical protein